MRCRSRGDRTGATAAFLVTTILYVFIDQPPRRPVPVYCQHVTVWGGLHTVGPIALVLSLPGRFPFREELQVMVFGVAVVSIGVRGLLVPIVLIRPEVGKSNGG